VLLLADIQSPSGQISSYRILGSDWLAQMEQALHPRLHVALLMVPRSAHEISVLGRSGMQHFDTIMQGLSFVLLILQSGNGKAESLAAFSTFFLPGHI